MINLIPETYRKSITIERTRRLVIISALLCSIASIIGIVLLLPSYTLVHARVRAAAVEENQMNVSDAVIAETSLQAITRDINEKLHYFPERFVPLPISERLAVFTAAVPKGIRLTALRYDSSSNSEVEMSAHIEIQGTATTRAILTQYETIVRGFPGVIRVESPVTNLLQNRDLDFTLHVYTSYE